MEILRLLKICVHLVHPRLRKKCPASRRTRQAGRLCYLNFGATSRRDGRPTFVFFAFSAVDSDGQAGMATVRPFFQMMRGSPRRRFSARTLRAARHNARNAARVSRLIGRLASPLFAFISFSLLLELYSKFQDSPLLIRRRQIRQPNPVCHRCCRKSPSRPPTRGNVSSD